MSRVDEFGQAKVTPATGTAGEWGTWVVQYQVGPRGLAQGAAIQIQLPESWHVWYRNASHGTQSTDPTRDNYVMARCAKAGVELECTVRNGTTDEFVKANRVGIDGRSHRYAFVTEVRIRRGQLATGEEVEIVFGDQQGGSRGFAGPLHPHGDERLRVALDVRGSGHFTAIPSRLTGSLRGEAGPPVELTALAPSQLKVGQQGELHLALLDYWQNAVSDVGGTVVVSTVTGSASYPTRVAIAADHIGAVRIPFTSRSPGILRLNATIVSGDAKDLEAVSNPCRITDAGDTTLPIYWGDLHSHSLHSFDATGRRPFNYARDVASLDFYCLTDHAETLSDESWQEIISDVAKYHVPGKFVTILGYEATFSSPWAHHNVYFVGDRGPLFGANQGSLPELWHHLEAEVGGNQSVLTIPHHTGVRFSPLAEGAVPGGTGPNPDWRHSAQAENPYRPVIEIYSGHGQCESLNIDHPLAYEHCDFSLNTSAQGPHYAWDAWIAGQHLGVICSSDNHQSQPGLRQTGLAAVRAPRLTRAAIFEAIRSRQTYGTTGERILLDWSVAGSLPGSQVHLDGPVRMVGMVSGSAQLDHIEIIRGDLSGSAAQNGDANTAFQIVHAVTGQGGLDLSIEWEDTAPPTQALYYLRVRQRDYVRGRLPMAWSTPVWVARA